MEQNDKAHELLLHLVDRGLFSSITAHADLDSVGEMLTSLTTVYRGLVSMYASPEAPHQAQEGSA